MDLFVLCVCLCTTAMSVSCSLVVTCWERAHFLVLFSKMFSLWFYHFSIRFPGSRVVQLNYVVYVVLDCINS